MLAVRSLLIFGAPTALVLSCGCALVPTSELHALRSQNAALVARNQDQAAQAENLQVHSRNIEDQLMRAEEDLSLVEEQQDLRQSQLANYRQERDLLHTQFVGLADRRSRMTPELSGRLAEISRRYSGLQFDPQTGVSKLDTDILFDVGTAELKPAADDLLRELVGVLNSPEARDLKVMVVGHTDDRQVVKRPARDNYRNNFHLSADRALAVAELMGRLGLPEQRMGVAGFGSQQPVAPNLTPKDRQKNRRVELFVLAPDVPVIGWTETIPSVY